MFTPATPITIAYGDGIGPEIMEATLRILQAAGASLAPEVIEIGQKIYEGGNSAGIEDSSWASLRRTKVFLKAPITTPQGGGFKSLNVTVRKTLGLYANVRPCASFHPYISTKHPKMDLVIVRENEEDCYAGIEYKQTDEVTQCLKIITRTGSEKIVRYAFEYAKRNGRKKVSCLVKDNIMKITDGLFHAVFKEIAQEYPDIEHDSWIVDIGAARIADTPEIFDVLVMPNLYGDILSDVAAQISGSVGLGSSSNIGDHIAMFEAIHGSAPTIAGQNIANPSGLLLAAVLMLNHIGQHDVAAKVHNAWFRTIEEGVHTGDIYKADSSKAKVGTREFASAVIERLGKLPEKFTPVTYKADDIAGKKIEAGTAKPRHVSKRELVGADMFITHSSGSASVVAAELGGRLAALELDGFNLSMISNRGVKVWPHGMPETWCMDLFRCRFKHKNGVVSQAQVVTLLDKLTKAGFEVIKFEGLLQFDGKPGYSLGQGE